MKRLPHIIFFLIASLFLAADKKDQKPTPSDSQIQLWVKQLGDESFKVREEATRNLIKAGRVAFDTVTRATQSEDPEVKQRALLIVKPLRKLLKKADIAYFKKLGAVVTVDTIDPSKPLIELYFGRTKITDDGLVRLKRFTNLRGLYLRHTKITDAGLVNLKGLINLENLSLMDTDITDVGLAHLKGLSNLRRLALNDTKVTQAGIEKLQKALPNCDIRSGE